MRKIISLLFFVVFAFCTQGQNENTKWYFGNHAALDFMTNPPTILNNSAMNTNEGCSSIADTAGNLLFYTDGQTVWNKQHTVMANGTGLLGNPSTIQSSIIIKKPNNSNLYYVFTLAASGLPTGLNYSIVDMSLAAGLGSITVKNAPIYNAQCTEQLHATKHANNTDYWIMIHELNTNNFRAYLLTSTGINTTAVISSIGTAFGAFGMYGCIKFSPTGQKLCATFGAAQVNLYDFNNSTGVVSNSLTLATSPSVGIYYSCEFSPNSSKLYAVSSSSITQWDLSGGFNAAILSSSININNSWTPRSLQLAPNGKIYIAIDGSQSLSIIDSPNIIGYACNLVIGGQPISATVNATLNSYSRSGLPNMITNMANTPCVTKTVSNSQDICSSSFYAISNHTYTTSGSYTDTLQNVFACNGIVIVITQLTVNPSYTVNNPQSICQGSNYTFNNNTYSITGTYTDVLQTVLGCDSIVNPSC